MLTYRRTYIALIGVLALLFVACSDSEAPPTATPASVATVDETAATETPEPPASETADATPTPDSTPEPTVSVSQDSTPEASPEPEETPESDTESIGFYMRAFSYINRGEYVEAERTFTTVIELEPAFARGWDGRGQALMLQGRFEDAMLDFDRAIELKPNLADAYSNRALTRLALDDIDGASRDARRAVELDDESVGAQLVLGRVYARNGDAETALEWFNTAVDTEPEDGSTWWWRGRFYRDVLGEGNLALADFDKAIELAPAQAALYIDRALLFIQANVRAELARADLEEAISLSQDPKLPSIIARAEELLAVLDETAPAAQ